MSSIDDDASYVDGNAVLGALSLALGTDMGASSLECGRCRRSHPTAEARVYLRAPGMVLRCPSCEDAELVIVDRGGALQLTIKGASCIYVR